MAEQNGNGRRGWDLLEARLPLRSVVSIFVMVLTVTGAAWKLGNNIDHQFYDLGTRLTNIEGTIVTGRQARDEQIKDLRGADRDFAENIATWTATFVNFKRRIDTDICQHWPSSCVREP